MSWHVLVETKRVYKGFNVLGKEHFDLSIGIDVFCVFLIKNIKALNILTQNILAIWYS